MWKREEGEAVAQGDIIADIETDTAIMELEAQGSGFLRHILATEGSSVKTGTMLAIIGDLDDDTEAILKEALKCQKMAKINQKSSRPTIREKNKNFSRTGEPVPVANARTAASSKSTVSQQSTVHVEEQEKVNMSHSNTSQKTLRRYDTTQAARIDDNDVEDALQVVEDVLEDAATLVSDQASEQSLSSIISYDDIPLFHLTTEISMAEGERLREQMMDIQQTTLSLATLYVRAAALAFSRHLEFLDTCLGQSHSIDISIGLLGNDRMITPTLHDCGRKNIAELADEMHDIIHQIVADQWSTDDYSDPYFSITHLGMYPIEQFTPILLPPQRATLSIGAIRNVQLQEQGIVTTDRRATIVLTCRVSDFEEEHASVFLSTFKDILERPLAIFLPNRVE